MQTFQLHIEFSFIAGLENVLTYFCVMELLKSRLHMCMLGYYILTVRKSKPHVFDSSGHSRAKRISYLICDCRNGRITISEI